MRSEQTPHYKPSKQIVRPRGIQNTNNACFMIAVIQQLYYLDPFREAVLSVSIPLLCSKQMRVVQLLQQVFTDLQNTNTLPLSIQSFYDAFFEAHTSELVKNEINDASEFLIGLFDVFRHPSIPSSFKNTLASVFDVSYCQEVICPLGHVSSQLDSHYLQEVPPNNRSLSTALLQDYIGDFVDSYVCEKCASARYIQQCVCRSSFTSKPHVLIVHIKRFISTPDGETKNRTRFTFPSQLSLNRF